jgi:hypothetical protein
MSQELLRESDTDSDYDRCVRCGKITQAKKADHIDYRAGYIEGAGQLCFACTQQVGESANPLPCIYYEPANPLDHTDNRIIKIK